MARNKKRRHSRTVDVKRQLEQEKLAGEKNRAKNRWNPAGRALLWGDLVLLAAAALLERMGLVTEQAAGLATVMGLILLLAALWLLFGKRRKD